MHILKSFVVRRKYKAPAEYYICHMHKRKGFGGGGGPKMKSVAVMQNVCMYISSAVVIPIFLHGNYCMCNVHTKMVEIKSQSVPYRGMMTCLFTHYFLYPFSLLTRNNIPSIPFQFSTPRTRQMKKILSSLPPTSFRLPLFYNNLLFLLITYFLPRIFVSVMPQFFYVKGSWNLKRHLKENFQTIQSLK